MDIDQPLLRSLSIETLIPEDGGAELSELLEGISPLDDDSGSTRLNIKTRDVLFIDERVKAVASVRIPPAGESVLRSLLSKTELIFEVWQVDRPSGDDAHNPLAEPMREMIYSTTMKDLTDPIVVAQENDEDGDALILVWELDLVLNRPRMRMQDPSVHLHSVVLVSAGSSEDQLQQDSHVQFKPLEPNILEPMRNMLEFKQRAPYLAASHLERVRPTTPKGHKQFRVEHMSTGYKVVPAIITRLRYTKMNHALTLPSLIASLDFEVISVIDVKGTIERAEVATTHGKVENLMPQALPMECRSRDWISLLYRLHPSSLPSPTGSPLTPGGPSNVDVLSVELDVRIQITESYKALIHVAWSTNVDFFQALNPVYGAPSQPIQRVNRPYSLALNNGDSRGSQPISTTLQPVLGRTVESDVTVSFTAPDHAIEVGKAFLWHVLVVNNSSKPAKLAIIPLPRIPRVSTQSSQFARRHAPKSSTASFQPAERRHTRDVESDVDFAQAVVDENVMYAMQHSNTASPATDLISLTAELRIGPLGPGQCHESVIEMMPLTAGTLRVDAIRVIDLMRESEEGVTGTGVMIDIRDLPDVVVVASSKTASIDS